MTPQELSERAQRAQAAWDEFFAPFVENIRADYLHAMSRAAADAPENTSRIVQLAVAQRTIDLIENQFQAVILDGVEPARNSARAEQIQGLPARKRKWTDFGAKR